MKNLSVLSSVGDRVIVSSNRVFTFAVYFRHSFLKIFCRERSIAIRTYRNGYKFRSVSSPLVRIGGTHALPIGTHIAHQTNSPSIEIRGIFRRQIDEITRSVYQAPANIMAIGRAIASEVAKIVRTFQRKPSNGNNPNGAV